MTRGWPIIVAIVAVMAILISRAGAEDAGLVLFEKKIRPVLVEQCQACHADKKQRGGLRVDSRDALRQGGDSGPALVPGQPEKSLLVKALRYRDDELKMPPKGKLADDVIASFEKWIALGAPDPRGRGTAADRSAEPVKGRDFWCFQSPRPALAPTLKDRSWSRGPIDRFILAALEAKGLRPAPDADRPTLLRRVYFALIGLPPSPAEIDRFVKDGSPQALAHVLDRLLASPRFGERWGRHWLDVARFAESSGGGRSLLFKEAWRYRDYVVHAFNNDKSFARFIMEQVAGDLLPAADDEQRYWQLVALAFLMLGPINYERQDKPVLEMDVIDEQLDTLGKGFLGMTIGCARCHDHKFDPIPTRDYYALAGIFKSSKMLIHDNVSRWVETPLPLSQGQAKAIARHESEVAVLKDRIRLARQEEVRLGKSPALPAGKPITADALPGIVVDDVQARKVGSWKHSTYSGNFVGNGYLYDDRGFKDDKTVTFTPDIPRPATYEVRLAYVPHENRATRVPVRVFHADGDNTLYVNQRKRPPIDGRFLSLGRYRFEKGTQWFVMLSTDGADGHVVADAVQFLPVEQEQDERPRPAQKSAGPGALSSADLEAELKRLQDRAPGRPMAMGVREGDQVGDCHVCIRGNVHNPGERVPRGFLQAAARSPMPAIPAGASGRRQLAEWLASPDNPLTARVLVNRVWHHLFGAGLVRSVDNFGATGERPSHPELLDYLAIRFVEQGWSIKTLIREIMLTRAYGLAAGSDGWLREADPDNRLLGRANRRRLEAECIRDAMLLVAGTLDSTVGGPTIRKGTTIERDYQFADTRRSVYTPIFRNRLLDLFEVFDLADPNLLMGKRNVSTTASQALYLMNSPFVMEQARHAADRILAVPTPNEAARIEHAFRLILGRRPSETERRLALEFLASTQAIQRVAWARLCQTLFAGMDFRYVN